MSSTLLKYGSKIVVIALLEICMVSCAQESNIEKPKPNIIYILADDLGYGDVSAYNENSKIQTPHIDRLAAQGVRFTDAHTSSAVCTPTRYGILTGRYNWRSTLKQGVLSGYSKSLIEKDRVTVASFLRENGYITAAIGKWHLGWDWDIQHSDSLGLDNLKARPEVDFTKPVENGINSHGFDYSYAFCGSLDMPPYVWVENDKPTMVPTDTTAGKRGQGMWRKGLTSNDFMHEQVLPEVTEKSVTYINTHAGKNEPFFLYMPLPAPHTPILPTAEFQGKSGLENPYADFVLMVDSVVGEITKALEENGISENTLIVFTSDNGCSPAANFKELKAKGHNPSYVYRGYKSDIFDGGHRVPYIMHWKGKIEAGKSEQLVCTTDLFATIADLIGVTYPDTMAEDSYSSLSATNLASTLPIRENMVHHSITGEFAYRKGDWKVNFTPGSGGWSYPNKNNAKTLYDSLPEVQLYDMKNDIGEQNNLEAEHPDLISEYQAELVQIITNGRSTPGEKKANDTVEEWPQLVHLKSLKIE